MMGCRHRGKLRAAPLPGPARCTCGGSYWEIALQPHSRGRGQALVVGVGVGGWVEAGGGGKGAGGGGAGHTLLLLLLDGGREVEEVGTVGAGS